ncbi:hypothetical protein PNEG_01167 [Pneumocystis murina B123]|uniref:mRNA export factor GLE1 n=1 Tax=Pneumocystis murina (strain B123) TaxID=1069680 RepID=M7NT46_PNEMU|nr:hypothetical protein PNEG_01167 [Pneumocystis murina B123]EMR10452.1 hypothetical protein PNEG_01167 [Pneumocystis murina B123]
MQFKNNFKNLEDTDDDIYDSEDEEYPVNFGNYGLDSWHLYNQKTKEIVHSAMKKKASEIDHAFSLIGNRTHCLEDCSKYDISLEKHLEKITMKHKEMDFKESILFEHRNKEIVENIEKAIKRADEEEKEIERKNIEIKQQEMIYQKKLEEKNTKILEKKDNDENKVDSLETINVLQPIAEEKKTPELKKEYVYNAMDRVLMYKKRIEDIKLNVLKPVSENATWRAFCFQNKRKITPKCGQLTNSKQQITRITRDLEEIIKTSKEVAITVYHWILNFLSKAIIKQAETEVTVNLYSAYPLATVCVFLMSTHPDLVDILLARFAKKCPYTIPYFNYNKNTEEGRKALGFYRSKNGKFEEEASYTERQCGIFAVFSAIMQTQYIPNHLPIRFGWTLLAKILNESPSSETVFAIISTFIDIAGNAFMKHYGLQADKLIRLAVNEWAGNNKGSNATRLRVLGEEWITNKKIGLKNGGQFEE